MKHFIFFILILALLQSCSSKKNQESKALQLDSITADSYKKLFSEDLSPFNWSSIEVKMTDEEKRKQIKLFTPWVFEENIDSAYVSRVHILDINNDGKYDYVYSGSGAAQFLTQIFITRESDTTRFNNFSIITGVDTANRKIKRLYFQTILGSGAPGISGYSIVDISYGTDSIRFVPRIMCEQVHSLVAPKNFSPFEAEVSVDSLTLRRAPLEYDTIYDFALERETTQLGKIRKGTKAIIAGTSIDSLNTKWYFTLIKPGVKIEGYTYINMTFNPNDNMYRVGWTKAEGWKK